MSGLGYSSHPGIAAPKAGKLSVNSYLHPICPSVLFSSNPDYRQKHQSPLRKALLCGISSLHGTTDAHVPFVTKSGVVRFCLAYSIIALAEPSAVLIH